jgi:hypothetical protein
MLYRIEINLDPEHLDRLMKLSHDHCNDYPDAVGVFPDRR